MIPLWSMLLSRSWNRQAPPSAFDGSSSYSSYDYSGMTQDEAMAVASASIFLMVGLSLGYVLCKVVCLVAGIIACATATTLLNWALPSAGLSPLLL